MTAALDELREMAARVAVSELVYRYCRAFDTADAAALEQLLAPDVVVVSGGTYVGREAATAYFLRSWSEIDSVRHHVSNVIVELDTTGAWVTSYFMSVLDVGGEPRIAFGTYRDRLETRDGSWVFVEKHHDLESYGPFADGWSRTSHTPWPEDRG
jgi:ketosteroid isomerase-like protein